MKECCKVKTSGCSSPINPQAFENFSKDRKRPDGLMPQCKSCNKSYRENNRDRNNKTILAWRKRNPEKVKASRERNADKNTERMRKWRKLNRLQFLYSISNEEWAQMFQKQEGKCLICDVHAKDLKRGLAVDHCHSTGKIRGLLCHICNQGIGMFKDDISIMTKAMEYLKKT